MRTLAIFELDVYVCPSVSLCLCAYMYTHIYMVSLSLGEVWKTKSWLSAVNNEPALCSRTCAVGHLSRIQDSGAGSQEPGGAGRVYVSPMRMSPTYKNRNAFTEFPPHAGQLVHPHPLLPLHLVLLLILILDSRTPGLAARLTAQLFACIVVVMPAPPFPFSVYPCIRVPFYLV